jgi:hypothetical protein
LQDQYNVKKTVIALVYTNDGTAAGQTSNETVMAIFSDYPKFTMTESSLGAVYRDSESASVNMFAEFNAANAGIGLEINPGMNLRKAYSATSVPLADLANVALTAGNLTVGTDQVLASTVFHAGSTNLVPTTTDSMDLGDPTVGGGRFNNAYLGGSIVLGDPGSTGADVIHNINDAGGSAKISVGTASRPVKTLYVDNIHMNGAIVGLAADSVDALGSSSNYMGNAFLSKLHITSTQHIDTDGMKGLDIKATDGTLIFDASTGNLQNTSLSNAITDGDGIATFSYNGGVADTVAVDSTVIRTSGTQTLAGSKSFTAEILATAGVDASSQTVKFGSLSDGVITITQFVDEDTMSSNSATQIPTQQSVKAYVDTQITSNTTGDIAPAVNNTSSLGSASFKYANVHATTFNGVATSAQYADMAEIYSADADYEAGTVVKIGGDAEITMTIDHSDTDVFGVISTAPAYLMNSEAEGLPVALSGRVPVKVIGKIKKGQRLVSSDIPGVAWASMEDEYDPRAIVGRSLEDKNDGGEGTVEAVIGVR